jgi:hypothetical protein
MLRSLRRVVVRGYATSTAGTAKTDGGDISDVFPSLRGETVGPLPKEFSKIQERIIEAAGGPEMLQASWDRLLPSLAEEVATVKKLGNRVIPQIDMSRISADGEFPGDFQNEVRKRGVGIVRNVVPRDEARQWKYDLDDYISKNPVKGFPEHNPTIFELYWSKSQLRGRTHPNSMKVQKALQQLWHSKHSTQLPVSLRHSLTYADRLRMRPPGDQKFALGPHIDAGGIERWEDVEYSKVYSKILYEGSWEDYDPFDYTFRLTANSDLHEGQGQCSMFRLFQGWLGMSETGPREGSLQVNPMIKHATAYLMLRPFFAPETAINGDSYDPTDNNMNVPWRFAGPTSVFPNSLPGCVQELSPISHPHLELEHTMVSLPKMYPGDFIAWHTDTIHAVEKEHQGTGDASVLYIPAVALTQNNLDYVVKEKAAYLRGSPAPDYPDADGTGEHGFIDVGTDRDILTLEGAQALGLGNVKFNVSDARTEGERIILQRANEALYPHVL